MSFLRRRDPAGTDIALPALEASIPGEAALEAVMRLSAATASALSLDDAVRKSLSAAGALLAAPQASIMLLDDAGSYLEVVAGTGVAGRAEEGRRVAANDGIAGHVIARGVPLLLGRVDAEAVFTSIRSAAPVESCIVAPLPVGGRCIGVLILGRPDGRFADADLPLAQLLAEHAAGLLHRAKLHDHAQRRTTALRALVDAGRRLTGTLDEDRLLQYALDGATTIAQAENGFVCLFDPRTGAATSGVYRGMTTRGIGEILQRPEVQRVQDTLVPEVVGQPPHGPIALFGLRGHAGTKGIIGITLDESQPDDHVELVSSFAQQCGSAIAAAQVHSLVERKESELSSIIHAVPSPIVVADEQGRIVALNAAAEQLFGVSSMFSVGAPVAEMLGHSEVAGLLTSPSNFQGEIAAGAPPRVYKATVGDLHAPGGPTGRVLIMDDVTAERAIVQTQRDFVAMIGHELRTPLTVVKGFARTLLRCLDRAPTEDLRAGLTTIDERARQLERLIEDLLYVSGIESREATLHVEVVELLPLVRGVIDELLTVHDRREVELRVREDLVWPCDPTKIGLVLHHLVDNALKFSAPDGAVAVSLLEDQDGLRADVIDRGPGILSSDIPNLFKRFRQLDPTSTREHGGMGVGLYLCSQLVRMHEGRIWVDSTWGKGSTFSFSLPHPGQQAEPLRIVGAGAPETDPPVAGAFSQASE